jgi:hypothetical protein
MWRKKKEEDETVTRDGALSGTWMKAKSVEESPWSPEEKRLRLEKSVRHGRAVVESPVVKASQCAEHDLLSPSVHDILIAAGAIQHSSARDGSQTWSSSNQSPTEVHPP